MEDALKITNMELVPCEDTTLDLGRVTFKQVYSIFIYSAPPPSSYVTEYIFLKTKLFSKDKIML